MNDAQNILAPSVESSLRLDIPNAFPDCHNLGILLLWVKLQEVLDC